jgi:hypothetical protein
MSTHLVDDYATVQSHWRQKESDGRVARLSDIIKFAHDDGLAQEAAIMLYEFLNNLNDDELAELIQQANVAGPLAHALSRLIASKNRNVLLYCARTLKTLMRDSGSRRGLCKAGLARSISLTLQSLQADASGDSNATSIDIQREFFCAVQNILFDHTCAVEFSASGGLKTIGDGLSKCYSQADLELGGTGSSAQSRRGYDAELRLVLLACACNALSYCDTVLSAYIHEMRIWVDPVCASLITSRTTDSDSALFYAVCCLANATRDPGLTHAVRSANGAEVLDRCRHREARIAEVASVAVSRLQLSSGVRNDLDRVWRFRWGGSKFSAGIKSNEVVALLAFLFVVTAVAGFIILVIIHFSKF